jgi:hypothetical protein
MYLFSLKNGKRKLAYGQSPEDALEILSIRLTPDEMAEVIPTEYIRVNQREMQKHVGELG